MTIPTPRCALLVAGSVPVALILATVYPESAHAALYLPLLAFVLCLFDLFKMPPGKSLEAKLDLPSLFSVGVPEKPRLVLRSPDNREKLAVNFFLETKGELSGSRTGSVELDGAEENAEANLVLTPAKRGKARIENLWLSYRGPLKFLETRIKIPLEKEVETIQNVLGLHEEALSFYAKDQTLGLKAQRLKGVGSEFDNLTDYSQGMDNRFIDWKRSARHRKLLAKEFRPEKNNRIILGFDTGRLMTEPAGGRPKLDHFARAGLMLGWVSLKAGDMVGACSFDRVFRNFLAPGRTASFFLKLRKFTSALEYEPAETNFTLCLTELATRLKHRALVVLFTEFGDGVQASLLLECLELMAKRHAVLFVSIPDPASSLLPNARPDDFHSMAEAVIADSFRKERAVVLERMTRLGVHSIDTREDRLSGALINRYLAIKQRGLL
jgi:uncharacterized protein (DUF58 family)